MLKVRIASPLAPLLKKCLKLLYNNQFRGNLLQSDALIYDQGKQLDKKAACTRTSKSDVTGAAFLLRTERPRKKKNAG